MAALEARLELDVVDGEHSQQEEPERDSHLYEEKSAPKHVLRQLGGTFALSHDNTGKYMGGVKPIPATAKR